MPNLKISHTISKALKKGFACKNQRGGFNQTDLPVIFWSWDSPTLFSISETALNMNKANQL